MNSITQAYLDAAIPAEELDKALREGLAGMHFPNGHLPRPLFLSRHQRTQLDADLRLLHTALTTLPERLFDGDAAAFAAAVGAQGPQIDAARTAQGQVTRLARADLYRDAEGFKLLELNVSGAVGGLENARINEAYLDSPAFAQFAADHNLGHVDTMAALADTLREETGRAGDGLVGIVDWPDSYPNLEPQLQHNAKLLGDLGVEAIVGHLGMLDCRDGGVWMHGRRLDVVYRLFLVESLLRPGGPELLEPVLTAAARGEVAMFTPISSELYGSKTALALLSDSRDHFSAAELEAIDRVVPWTRRVEAGPVTVDGERTDLLSYARRCREQLVIKATMLHGGHGFVAGWQTGPAEWDHELNAAMGGPYVLQRRVVPDPELMPDPYTATWGTFLTARGYAGSFIRAVPGTEAGAVAYTGGALAGCVFHEN